MPTELSRPGNHSSNYIETVKSYQLVCTSTDTEPKPLTPRHQEGRHSQYCNDIARVTFLRYILEFTHRFLCTKNSNCYLSLGAGVTLFKIGLLNMYNLKQSDYI